MLYITLIRRRLTNYQFSHSKKLNIKNIEFFILNTCAKILGLCYLIKLNIG